MKIIALQILFSSLLFPMLICQHALHGQVTIEITPIDTIVCFGDSVAFKSVVSGGGSGTVGWQWQKDFTDISNATESAFIIRKVKNENIGSYRCIVSMNGLMEDTSNNADLHMYPRMNIDTLFRYNDLFCREDCKGQYKALVSKGTPFANYPFYMYNWHGGYFQDSIVFGLCCGNYIFSVTDSMGCRLDTGYIVDALNSRKIQLEFDPGTTLYFYLNSTLRVGFPDSVLNYLTSWRWDFGDGNSINDMQKVSHRYEKMGHYELNFYYIDDNGCDSVVTQGINVWSMPGLDEHDAREGLVIYPNPASDFLYVDVPVLSLVDLEDASIDIFNTVGQKILSCKIQHRPIEIDVRMIPGGFYSVLLKTTGRQSCGKFYKQ